MKKRPPRGRRPGAPDTAGQILAAARTGFGAAGYAGTSLRTIARTAGVDVALIAHHFGSKRALFERVAAGGPLDDEPLRLAVERGVRGDALVRAFLDQWDGRAGGEAIGGLLRAAADDESAQRLFGDLLARTLVEPVRRSLDPARSLTRLRAETVAALLAGIAWSRYVLRREPLASASPALVARIAGPSVDAVLTGADFPAGDRSGATARPTDRAAERRRS